MEERHMSFSLSSMKFFKAIKLRMVVRGTMKGMFESIIALLMIPKIVTMMAMESSAKYKKEYISWANLSTK